MPRTTRSALSPPGVSAEAMRIYDEAIVIDAHNDLFTRVLDSQYDPSTRHTAAAGHTDLPRLIESGITAQWMAAWVDAPYAQATPGASYARALTYLDTIARWVARHPGDLIAATTAADVRRAKHEGKVAILVGVEGGHAIEGSLDHLRELHRRGARYLTLTWNNGNAWAGSSVGVDATRTGGLTPFGGEVVREMNRLGMLIDVSHVSEATFADVLAASSAPVIASHSSARALADHLRNLTDAQLRALADHGGVACINFYSRFLADDYPTPAPPGVAPLPLSVLIDHIDHVASVAGIDHVGLGSDFDGISAVPDQMEDVTAMPRIAQALLDRGYAGDAIARVLGGNVLRIMG